MKLNRKLVLVVALVLSVAMATSGTLAYLSDTKTVTNTVAVGNVSIDLTEPNWKPEENPELLPGVSLDKDPRITNTGKTDAWVWMEVSIPTSVYDVLVFDWDNTEWTIVPEVEVVGTNTVVTMKHNDLLESGATTKAAFTKVSVDKGVKELPDVDTLDIVVTAYAIQDQPFANVEDAMKSYDGEKVVAPTQVSTAAELVSVLSNQTIKEDVTISLTNDIDMTGYDLAPARIGDFTAKPTVTVLGNGHTISNMTLVAPTPLQNGMDNIGMFNVERGSKLNISNLTIENAKTTETNYNAAIVVGYADSNSMINLNNVDIVNGTVNNPARSAALYVGYTVGEVNLTNCEATGTAEGEEPEKTGAFIGTANTESCVVTFTNCWNGTAMNKIGRVLGEATVIGQPGKITNVSTVDALKNALTAGGKVVVTADIEIPENTTITVSENTTLDLGNNTLTVNQNAKDEGVALTAIKVDNGTTLTIDGGKFVANFKQNGTDYTTGNKASNIFNVARGGTLIINNGDFKATQKGWNMIPTIIDNAGTVIINGGRFETGCTNLFRNFNGGNNQSMTINGGTFVGISPTSNSKYPCSVIWNQSYTEFTVTGGSFTNLQIEDEGNSKINIADGINLTMYRSSQN